MLSWEYKNKSNQEFFRKNKVNFELLVAKTLINHHMQVFRTETGWELASPEWRDWDRTGRSMFPNARDGKWHSGTQTSKLQSMESAARSVYLTCLMRASLAKLTTDSTQYLPKWDSNSGPKCLSLLKKSLCKLMSPVYPIFYIVSTVNSWSQTCSEC